MATAAKQVALVTGGNSGIGLELVAQLLQRGTWHVLLGARSPEKGQEALRVLQARGYPGTAELVQLDVTDDSTIDNTASIVEKSHGKLDLLVNNAGIALPPGTDREQLRLAFDTNATGPYVLASKLLPLLQKAATARIINVSSGIASITQKLDLTSSMHKVSAVQYRASKAAMNMVSAVQFVEYGDMGIKVFCYCPGFTVSNLSERNRAENGARSTGESVRSLMELVEGKRDAECGKFLHNSGTYPW